MNLVGLEYVYHRDTMARRVPEGICDMDNSGSGPLIRDRLHEGVEYGFLCAQISIHMGRQHPEVLSQEEAWCS
jgi:hypothetical protein